MAKYVNIIESSGNSTTTLLQKNTQDTGRISKILVSNNGTSPDAIVSFYLESEADSSIKYYFIKDYQLANSGSNSGDQVKILKDCLSFDISLYKLKIDHPTTTNLTVIIK
tara:strand:+ start:7826 stop:8155 length:330 start_codon:yes stop_codon:yes gene_type:complete